MRERLLVVTDVDNTLYDWVAIWAGAFATLIRTLAEKTDLSAEHWMKAARDMHVRRSATECPSLLSDLAAAASWPVNIDPDRVLPTVALGYRQYWDHHLTTYPGVREALTELAEQGHTIVAYTEGDVSIAAARVARLGLAGSIRRVFGRHPLPAAAQPKWCMVGVTKNGPIAVDFIPREDSKPNPTGLRTIICRCGGSTHTTVYVGDNLWKDVMMAQTLGVPAMWARYGTHRDPAHAQLLDKVAHWHPQSVSTERKTTVANVTPEAVLDTALDLPREIARRALSVAAS
jgi:phosphoglycolate phosphatase